MSTAVLSESVGGERQSAAMIAARRNLKLHQVLYAIKADGIRPCAKYGNVNVFDGDGIRRIERALDRIAARKALSLGTQATGAAEVPLAK